MIKTAKRKGNRKGTYRNREVMEVEIGKWIFSDTENIIHPKHYDKIKIRDD